MVEKNKQKHIHIYIEFSIYVYLFLCEIWWNKSFGSKRKRASEDKQEIRFILEECKGSYILTRSNFTWESAVPVGAESGRGFGVLST